MRGHHQLLSRIRGDITGIEWPPVPIGLTATLAALLRQLEDTQWLDPRELAAHQHRQLVALARHAATHSPMFRRRLERAGLEPGDLGSSDGLRALPPLGRRELQSAGTDLYCAELPAGHEPTKEARTSGSTGTPVIVRSTPMTRLFWLALTMREHLWHDRDLSRRFSSIRGMSTRYAESGDWGQPVNLLFPSGPMQRISARTDIGQQVEWLLRFRPHFLLTYPSNLDGIVQHCAKLGLRLPGLVDVRTISETLSPRIREDAERTLGARVIDQYSAAETGSIALECPQSGLYHVMSESVIVEVLDEAGNACREGEIGRVVVTSLHNFATPLIRYEIGDFAELGGACPCGRGLPTLKRILGRERNLIRIPDGTQHWPLLGLFVYQDIAPIVQFQFVQYELDKIEVRLVVEEPLSPDQEAALKSCIHMTLTYPFGLRFRYFETEIPRGAEGKFEQFICQVP